MILKRCFQTTIWLINTDNRRIDNLEEFRKKAKIKTMPRFATNAKWKSMSSLESHGQWIPV